MCQFLIHKIRMVLRLSYRLLDVASSFVACTAKSLLDLLLCAIQHRCQSVVKDDQDTVESG